MSQIYILTMIFLPLLTNLKSFILQVAYQNLAVPQSEARGREALLPSIFPPSCVSPAGKLRAVDNIARLDLTQPTAPRSRAHRAAGTDGRALAIGWATPAGDFAMATTAASSTDSSAAAAATSASVAATAAATASSRMLSQLKKKLSRFTISRDEGPVCDSGIYCYGE